MESAVFSVYFQFTVVYNALFHMFLVGAGGGGDCTAQEALAAYVKVRS